MSDSAASLSDLGASPVGLISEPMGNVATEQPGTALFPSTAFEDQDWLGLSKQLGRSLGNAAATYGTTDPESGAQLSEPEAPIAAADANKAYGIPGKLTFSAPVPASVAQSMQDAKQDEIAREDASARTPSGFWPSAARMGAGFVAGALDPLNLAAAFVPVLGEARAAGILARAGLPGLGEDVLAGVAEGGAGAIPSLGARVAVRGLAGAAGGLTAQAPLVGLRYSLSQQEQGDYTALDALGDIITMGAGLGALVHVGFGAIGDVLGQRFARSGAGAIVADDPAAAEAANRTAVSQMVSGNPVEVEPVTMAGFVQRSNAAAVVMARIASLQREADALRAEADRVPGHGLETVDSPESMIRPPALDAATQGRVDAVMDELTDPANPPPAARRAELLAEHQMLSEGAAGGSELEQARSEAQRSGLLIAAARMDDRIRELREGQPVEPGVASDERGAGGTPPVQPGFVRFFHGGDADPTSGGGRWVTTDPVYARDFRSEGTPKPVSYVDVPKGSPTELAARDEVNEGIYHHIEVPEDIAKGFSPYEPPASATVPRAIVARVQSTTAFDRALEAAHGAPSAEETAISRMADTATRDVKPDGPGGLPASLQTQLADIEDALQRADAAGLIGDPERSEIATANGWLDQAEAYANAARQAAACIARGMF